MKYCPNCFNILDAKYRCSQCSNIFEEPNPLQLSFNTILKNQYMVGKLLGQGGFGITYLCLDFSNNKLCCIKEFFPSSIISRNSRQSNTIHVSNNKYSRNYKNMISKFYNEGKYLCEYGKNSHIVKLFDYFYENETAYIVMEYIDGMDLKKHSKQKMFSMNEVIVILKELCDALQILHQKGVIHRDIRPENILLTSNNEIKLIDFGAARHYSQNETKGLSVILTPGYAPPEQWSREGDQGPWTDIYALGGTAYTLLTGLTPPTANERYNFEDKTGSSYLAISEINNTVSYEFELIINKMLQLDSSIRINDTSILLSEINKLGLNSSSTRIKKQETCKKQPVIVKESNKILRIIIFEDTNQKDYYFDEGEIINIGRLDCIIDINNKFVSRVHCYVETDVGKDFIRIINNSPNGIYDVNGICENSICLNKKGYFYILYPSIYAYCDIVEMENINDETIHN